MFAMVLFGAAQGHFLSQLLDLLIFEGEKHLFILTSSVNPNVAAKFMNYDCRQSITVILYKRVFVLSKFRTEPLLKSFSYKTLKFSNLWFKQSFVVQVVLLMATTKRMNDMKEEIEKRRKRIGMIVVQDYVS